MSRREDKEETQLFAIRHVLIKNSHRKLTPDSANEIAKEIVYEITEGPCSWAFKRSPNDT